MRYQLNLPPRPFNAIKNENKKIEGRTITENTHIDYVQMKQGDEILFTNENTGELLLVEITKVTHYDTVEEMLVNEGVENVLSSEPKTVEHGVESYNALTGYKEGIKKHGIFAIGIKPKA